MKNAFKSTAVAFLCMGAAGLVLAAQPGAATTLNTPTPRATTPQAPVGLIAPGTLTGFKPEFTEILADKPLNIKFEGFGHCKILFVSGDVTQKYFEGELPFSDAYTYGTGSMSSFQTYKDYQASVVPQGNCKLAKPITPVIIRTINPAPQGVPSSGSQGAMNLPVMASTQLTVNGLKPAPATLTSLTLASPVTVGAPTVLVAAGTGSCKFRLTHAVAETPLVSQVMQTFSTTLQKPFPMTLKTINQTPAGSYTWTANGIEGCTGSVKLDLVVS